MKKVNINIIYNGIWTINTLCYEKTIGLLFRRIFKNKIIIKNSGLRLKLNNNIGFIILDKKYRLLSLTSIVPNDILLIAIDIDNLDIEEKIDFNNEQINIIKDYIYSIDDFIAPNYISKKSNDKEVIIEKKTFDKVIKPIIINKNVEKKKDVKKDKKSEKKLEIKPKKVIKPVLKSNKKPELTIKKEKPIENKKINMKRILKQDTKKELKIKKKEVKSKTNVVVKKRVNKVINSEKKESSKTIPSKIHIIVSPNKETNRVIVVSNKETNKIKVTNSEIKKSNVNSEEKNSIKISQTIVTSKKVNEKQIILKKNNKKVTKKQEKNIKSNIVQKEKQKSTKEGIKVIASNTKPSIGIKSSPSKKKKKVVKENNDIQVISYTIISPENEILFHRNFNFVNPISVENLLMQSGLTINNTNGFIESINGISNKGMSGWVFEVNNAPIMVSASEYIINPNDQITWKYVDFSKIATINENVEEKISTEKEFKKKTLVKK